MGNDVYEIYALLPEQYKSDPEIVNATRIRRELDKRNSARQALVGKKYSDFDLLTPDQTAKKLSDYIGKSEFVLLSFWGSFCGPCIDKMPELKDVYEKYHDKGFEIISISMDNSLGMWRGGINKVDVPWIHLSDLKGDKSPLKEAYHILGVPYEILLDKEGTIIQVHVNGAFLHKFLHKELD